MEVYMITLKKMLIEVHFGFSNEPLMSVEFDPWQMQFVAGFANSDLKTSHPQRQSEFNLVCFSSSYQNWFVSTGRTLDLLAVIQLQEATPKEGKNFFPSHDLLCTKIQSCNLLHFIFDFITINERNCLAIDSFLKYSVSIKLINHFGSRT